MNAAGKSQFANALTAIASAVAILQTFLTTPPFPSETVAVMSGICTYLVLGATIWKQYLSPDVSNLGTKVTIWVAVAATLTGALNLVDVFTFSEDTSKWVKWGITVAVAIINIVSKQLFPSEIQKDRMHDLKLQK